MNVCPRCRVKDNTVLLDNDGDPYLCNTCWNDDAPELTPNQLVYTLKELQVCYDTEQLRDLFTDLLDDGYTGLSLGLVIDLIKQRLERIA